MSCQPVPTTVPTFFAAFAVKHRSVPTLPTVQGGKLLYIKIATICSVCAHFVYLYYPHIFLKVGKVGKVGLGLYFKAPQVSQPTKPGWHRLAQPKRWRS